MKSIFFFLNLLFVLGLFSQDTSYYDVSNTEVNVDKAYYYKVIIKDSTSNRAFEKQYYMNHVQKEQLTYSNYDRLEISGNRIRWDEEGNMTSSHLFKNGVRHGSSIEYYPDGKVKSKKEFFEGELENAKLGEEEVNEKEKFTIVEELPVYPGCEKLQGKQEQQNCSNRSIQEFVMKNKKNPEGFKTSPYYKSGLTLYVRYLINEEGMVEDAKVVHPENSPEEFLIEALNVVNKLPQMKPATQQGKPVRVQYTIPIRFAR